MILAKTLLKSYSLPSIAMSFLKIKCWLPRILKFSVEFKNLFAKPPSFLNATIKLSYGEDSLPLQGELREHFTLEINIVFRLRSVVLFLHDVDEKLGKIPTLSL